MIFDALKEIGTSQR